jgi:hypothetical protein
VRRRHWYIRKDWYRFYNALIPFWINRECYDLDCDLVQGEAQRWYQWLFWGIIVNPNEN